VSAPKGDETCALSFRRTFGGPKVLQIKDVPSPSVLPTGLVVRVKAVGINPVEVYIRSGRFPPVGQPPFILGWDISGVVESVVPGTNRFAVGDEVFGIPLFPRPANAYAEQVATPSRQLSRKPRTLDHVHAAALPLAGLTARQSLVAGEAHKFLATSPKGKVVLTA
jgi:NADPH:quinone reductase-like Zn-dependent oxidoreductase